MLLYLIQNDELRCEQIQKDGLRYELILMDGRILKYEQMKLKIHAYDDGGGLIEMKKRHHENDEDVLVFHHHHQEDDEYNYDGVFDGIFLCRNFLF
jgi:hypothetical protein